MKTVKILLLAIAALLAQTVLGHDAHYEITAPHKWTLNNGTHISGSFYLTNRESVLIETNVGQVKMIPISELCKSDQQFVAVF